jgi:hypothetical protein
MAPTLNNNMPPPDKQAQPVVRINDNPTPPLLRKNSTTPSNKIAPHSVLKNPSSAQANEDNPRHHGHRLRAVIPSGAWNKGMTTPSTGSTSCILSTMRTARSRDSRSRNLWASFRRGQLSRCRSPQLVIPRTRG